MRTVTFSELCNMDFYVKDIEIHCDPNVIPPVPFICKKGDKPFSRFFMIEQGSMLFYKDPSKSKLLLKAKEGDIVYLPCDVCYYSEWDTGKNGRYTSVLFNMTDNNEIISISQDLMCIVEDKDNIYRPMFTELYKTWIKGGIGYKISCKAHLYELIHNFALSSMKQELKHSYSNIYKGILYLENNYITDVSVNELAQMCHVSEGTFRRLFKEYKSMSPVKYRNMLRIRKAAELLKSGGYTVTEAAELVNMADICYFSKMFKKTMNSNPSECKVGE
ncbi:MAG: helix-turn-helix transcriptional regulator [Bacillota bacterium]|nr:helix-turn-helix transcriptional regulator [Bacillota bacterium]